MIRVTVNNRGVQAIPLSPVTVGAEGIVAAFLFSDDWAGLAKTAIFKGSGEEVEKIILNNECTVPPEVLAEAGDMLQVGVYGNDGHGTTIRPTVWGVVGRIEDGAISEDAGQTGTTPSWAAQVQNAVQEAITTANNAVIAAEENADDSEAWAVGTRDGEAIPETDPAHQNYAKYWAEQAAASATEGAESASAASGKANEAAASAGTASNKAGEAATSAGNAAASAEAANAAKTAAQNAQTAAEQAKAGAETARDASSSSASQAAESATQAAGSASDAAQSATAAHGSESAAATSAQNAAASEAAAATSARNAGNSASAAATSETNAANSATAAAGSAGNAATSEQNASASATAAANSVTAAQTAQSAAEDAQGAAETAAASVSSSAAQIAQNTSDISDLNRQISDVEENQIPELKSAIDEGEQWVNIDPVITAGAVGSSETPYSTDSFDNAFVSVREGEKVKITGFLGNTGVSFIAWKTDTSSGSFVSNTEMVYDAVEYTVPSGITRMFVNVSKHYIPIIEKKGIAKVVDVNSLYELLQPTYTQYRTWVKNAGNPPTNTTSTNANSFATEDVIFLPKGSSIYFKNLYRGRVFLYGEDERPEESAVYDNIYGEFIVEENSFCMISAYCYNNSLAEDYQPGNYVEIKKNCTAEYIFKVADKLNSIDDIETEVTEIETKQLEIDDILKTEYAGNNFQTGFWSNGTGEYNGSRHDYVCTTKMIPVNPGDTVTVKNIPFLTGSGYFIEYDVNKTYINSLRAYSIQNYQFSGVVAPDVYYLHFDLAAGGTTLNPEDFADVSIIINGVDITKNAIERLEDEISGDGGNGFVIGSDFLKKSVNTAYLGNVTYGQSFCVYDGKYYSTDGQNIGVQDSSFTALSTTSINVGHGNNFQLGDGNIAYISGWSDNNVYVVNMDTLTVSEIISLGTTGYTVAVIDERNTLAYIFQRDSYPDTVANYNFIVYDYSNHTVKSSRVINAFGAMQAADYHNGKIIVVWGLGTLSVPSGMAVYNTNGDILAEYSLDIFANAEPEGVCLNRETNELLIGIATSVYRISL